MRRLMPELNRKQFLAAATAAAATAGGVRVARAQTPPPAPEPIRGDEGATILCPHNAPIERANPDVLVPPVTDAGYMENLKFPFAAARMRLERGGWARQVSIQDLSVATTIAGVDMRLQAGAIRELHWHSAGEWALMLAGDARITAMNPNGANFIADVRDGDLWFFPTGVPHSIQALGEGCEFLLVFDQGDFTEFGTFLLTDWISHTPQDVLAKNFGVAAAAFSKIPPDIEQQRYIFPGTVPGPISRVGITSPEGTVPDAFAYRTGDQKPIDCPGGRVRIVDSSTFKASTTIAAAIVDIDPGGMRELHWHPNADEWQYYVSGQGRMTVFAAGGTANTFDYQAGDVGYVPFPMGHYVENTGSETLRFLELFRAPRFEDVSLNQWMALTPRELIREHLPLDNSTIAALSKRKQIVVGGKRREP
jgi:oxalate decarboxylase